MAEVIASGAGTGKLRRPLATALLSLIPFYWIVWYYRINRELRDFGRAGGDDALATSRPRLSALAVTIGGWVVVPYYVSVWRTGRRVERAAGTGGVVRLIAPLLAIHLVAAIVANSTAVPAVVFPALAVALIAGGAIAAVLQRRLNTVWRHVDHPQEG